MTKANTYSIKSLPGSSGHRVSSAGEVFYERQGSSDELIPMTPQMTNGSFCVQLPLNGKPRNYSVAALVCTTFHGPRPSPRHVPVRTNGKLEDNRAANLRWGTRSESVLACRRAGRQIVDTSERQPDEKAIPNVVEGYFATPHGIVTSYRYGRRKVLTQRPLHGYASVQLERAPGKFQPINVGPLVLVTHVRPRRDGEVCRYRDGNRQNVDVANLHWGTRKTSKVTSKVRSKDLDATGSKPLDVGTQAGTHEATQGTQEATCGTLSTAAADHPANGQRRAGGPAEGVGVDFLRIPASALTGPPPYARGREIEHGRGQP